LKCLEILYEGDYDYWKDKAKKKNQWKMLIKDPS
jgi:hypothetical protein